MTYYVGKIMESSADNRCRSDGDEYREFLGGIAGKSLFPNHKK